MPGSSPSANTHDPSLTSSFFPFAFSLTRGFVFVVLPQATLVGPFIDDGGPDPCARLGNPPAPEKPATGPVFFPNPAAKPMPNPPLVNQIVMSAIMPLACGLTGELFETIYENSPFRPPFLFSSARVFCFSCPLGVSPARPILTNGGPQSGKPRHQYGGPRAPLWPCLGRFGFPPLRVGWAGLGKLPSFFSVFFWSLVLILRLPSSIVWEPTNDWAHFWAPAL